MKFRNIAIALILASPGGLAACGAGPESGLETENIGTGSGAATAAGGVPATGGLPGASGGAGTDGTVGTGGDQGTGGNVVMDPAKPPQLSTAYTGSGAGRGAAANDGALNIGHQFTVSRTVTVHELGVWDEKADGLAKAHAVTLFRLDAFGPGAQAEAVDGGSVSVPAGMKAHLEDGFRFAPLTAPIALAPGKYAAVVYGLDVDDPYGDGGYLPVPETGITHGGFSPFEFSDDASPNYPVGGEAFSYSSVSLRFDNGEKAIIRILPLGDSITDGIGGTDASYRRMLADKLREAEVTFQYVGSATYNAGSLSAEQVRHDGHSGWVIAEGQGRDGLQEHMGAWLAPTQAVPDVVLLMIGTNDVGTNYELESAHVRLGRLIDTLLNEQNGLVPGAQVILAKIVPMVNDNDDLKVVAYNQGVQQVAAEQVAKGHDVVLVDMHAALNDADMADGLHPNDAGYQKMAQVWFDGIIANLR